MNLADEFANLETRRAAIRAAVAREFDVSGDARYVVRRADIYASVKRQCGIGVMNPATCREIAMLCCDLGAQSIKVSQRRLVRGVRRKGMPDAIALAQSRALRTPDPGKGGKDGKRGKGLETSHVDFEKILSTEGMGAEPSFVHAVDPVKAELASARIQKAELLSEVLRLYRGGLAIRKIAAETGANRNMVHRLLVAAGLCKSSDGKQEG